MATKTPQLSMSYATSNEYTPGNLLKEEEQVNLNVSINLPEVRSPLKIISRALIMTSIDN